MGEEGVKDGLGKYNARVERNESDSVKRRKAFRKEG